MKRYTWPHTMAMFESRIAEQSMCPDVRQRNMWNVDKQKHLNRA